MSLQTIVDPEEVEDALVSHLKEKDVLQDGPRPWTIRYSQLGGRGVFATRDIEQNELIFIDAPLLLGPKCVGSNLQTCVCCYKNECPLFQCDRGCGLPVCSNECENSSKHVDYECEYLRSLVPKVGTDWSLDLLRAVTPIRVLFLTEQQRKCLAALAYDRTRAVNPEIELLKKNVTNMPCEEDIELMKRVCNVFDTTSFETVSVHDKERAPRLRGLYPMGALQNHCCVPNTRHHFDGKFRLYVNASLPILAGEEITMSYTSLFWDTTLRRQFLSSTKYFSCTCKRCTDPTEFGSKLGALFCASEKCFGHILPQDPLNMKTTWVCDTCAKTINHKQIRPIRSGIAAIMQEIIYKTPRQIFKFMQKELLILVPETNYLMMDVKFRLISYYGRSEDLTWKDLTDTELDTKWKYCNDLLSILDALNCGDCRKRGLILYELYCTNLEKFKRLKQQSCAEKTHSYLLSTINENQRLLEKANIILQNDILSAVTYENDQEYFKQPISVHKVV